MIVKLSCLTLFILCSSKKNKNKKFLLLLSSMQNEIVNAKVDHVAFGTTFDLCCLV